MNRTRGPGLASLLRSCLRRMCSGFICLHMRAVQAEPFRSNLLGLEQGTGKKESFQRGDSIDQFQLNYVHGRTR
jgi:hypothetical protein